MMRRPVWYVPGSGCLVGTVQYSTVQYGTMRLCDGYLMILYTACVQAVNFQQRVYGVECGLRRRCCGCVKVVSRQRSYPPEEPGFGTWTPRTRRNNSMLDMGRRGFGFDAFNMITTYCIIVKDHYITFFSFISSSDDVRTELLVTLNLPAIIMQHAD